MKKFIRRIHDLSQRANELKEALQNVPPKVAEIREAVTLTAGELQQLQADVERNVTDLKTEGRDRLVEALHEVNGSVEVFQEAGYELGEVELELCPVSRLMVHLNRVDDVHESMLRSLTAANKQRTITHALLTAVQQAESMADKVDISGLVYYKLICHIGPVPAIRLCWMPEVEETFDTPFSATTTEAGAAPGANRLASTYGHGSFFGTTGAAPKGETTEPPASDADAVTTADKPPAPAAEVAAAPSKPHGTKPYRSGGKDWGASALERFKKMPSVSKYGR